MNRMVLVSLGLSLVLTACPNDSGTSASGSATDGSTSDTSASTSNSTPGTVTNTTNPTTVTEGGSGSATDATDPTSGTTASTDSSGATAGTSSSGSGTTAETDPSGTSTTGMVMTTGEPGVCGDGVMDAGEECDDGNMADGDGCSANCTIEQPVCGNGKVEGNEMCDDGNMTPGDGCEPDCTPTPNPCGHGMLDAGEECDGAMLPETECAMLDTQYSGGTVTCAANCLYDFAACEKCEAPGMIMPCDSDAYMKGGFEDILHAMELNCQTADPIFADVNKHVPVSKIMPKYIADGSWRVIKQFGTYLDPMDMNKPIWRPRNGDRMLVISTGNLPAGQDILTQAGGTISGTNLNPDDMGNLPGIMKWQKGSNNGFGGTPFMMCDKVNDCSDTLAEAWNIGPFLKDANDVFYVQFDVAVPKGTHGYVVDFAYFSSHYPVWVNTAYVDMAVLWQVSEIYTGNVIYITDQNNKPQPLTVSTLYQNNLVKYRGNKNPKDPQLNGTGFEDNGGTGWATIKGPAMPQETLTLAWSVFDKNTTDLDTALLIDNWKWDCAGCVPSQIGSCGVQPQ